MYIPKLDMVAACLIIVFLIWGYSLNRKYRLLEKLELEWFRLKFNCLENSQEFNYRNVDEILEDSDMLKDIYGAFEKNEIIGDLKEIDFMDTKAHDIYCKQENI